jgi:hypothetical protein
MRNKTFFGIDLSSDDLELRALTRIPQAARTQEAQLYTTRWWDYRPMHPALATYLFADEYEKAVRDIYAKTKDLDEALRIEVWKGEKDIFHRALDTISLWRARQFCDRVGVRYDFALRFAMNRAADRGWTMFPRPNQIYEETLIRDVKTAWEEHLRHIFDVAKHEDYLLSNDRGEAHQVAYRAWLVERCNSRQRPQAALSRCFREGHLNSVYANGHFSKEVIAEAVRTASL